jgi:hypothetical protein
MEHQLLVQALNTNLPELEGVVIRQESQFGELLAQMAGIPFEVANRYKISALPPGKKVAQHPGDEARWQPTDEELTALPTQMIVAEDSNCFVRFLAMCCGVGNLRPLKLNFLENGSSVPKIHANRPFRLGVCCFGCRQRTDLILGDQDGGELLGSVQEECVPVDNCCFCQVWTNIKEPDGTGALQTSFKTRLPLACLGAHNNCCGATCFKNDLVYDILDSLGQKVASVQKTYAPGGVGKCGCSKACIRMGGMFSNYIIEFPKSSTARQRALIIASVLHNDYIWFEKKGNENQ